jgi:hypothetical protein
MYQKISGVTSTSLLPTNNLLPSSSVAVFIPEH